MTTDNIGAELPLTSSRCQCPTCGRFFNSTSAFDLHRTGPMTARVCVYPPERGMSLNAAGYWITEPRHSPRPDCCVEMPSSSTDAP